MLFIGTSVRRRPVVARYFRVMSQFLCSGGDKKMAESKGSLLAKSVSKHAGRAKEKVIN